MYLQTVKVIESLGDCLLYDEITVINYLEIEKDFNFFIIIIHKRIIKRIGQNLLLIFVESSTITFSPATLYFMIPPPKSTNLSIVI